VVASVRRQPGDFDANTYQTPTIVTAHISRVLGDYMNRQPIVITYHLTSTKLTGVLKSYRIYTKEPINKPTMVFIGESF